MTNHCASQRYCEGSRVILPEVCVQCEKHYTTYISTPTVVCLQGTIAFRAEASRWNGRDAQLQPQSVIEIPPR